MDWTEERYVRLYVRDTTTWKLLRWQGQCVLALLIRKLNRAGRMDLAGCSPAEAAELHTDLPTEVVEPGMEACLKRGVFVVEGDALVMPHFAEAQEAKSSAAQRKREQRARDRDISDADVTKRDTGGTEGDERGRESHISSHGVTLSLAEPSLAEPSQPPSPLPGAAEGSGVVRDPHGSTGADRVAAAYRDATGNEDLRTDGQYTPRQTDALLDVSSRVGGDYDAARAEFERLLAATPWLASQPVHVWAARWGTGSAAPIRRTGSAPAPVDYDYSAPGAGGSF